MADCDGFANGVSDPVLQAGRITAAQTLRFGIANDLRQPTSDRHGILAEVGMAAR
jgi:hypothetical protein